MNFLKLWFRHSRVFCQLQVDNMVIQRCHPSPGAPNDTCPSLSPARFTHPVTIMMFGGFRVHISELLQVSTVWSIDMSVGFCFGNMNQIPLIFFLMWTKASDFYVINTSCETLAAPWRWTCCFHFPSFLLPLLLQKEVWLRWFDCIIAALQVSAYFILLGLLSLGGSTGMVASWAVDEKGCSVFWNKQNDCVQQPSVTFKTVIF